MNKPPLLLIHPEGGYGIEFHFGWCCGIAIPGFAIRWINSKGEMGGNCVITKEQASQIIDYLSRHISECRTAQTQEEVNQFIGQLLENCGHANHKWPHSPNPKSTRTTHD